MILGNLGRGFFPSRNILCQLSGCSQTPGTWLHPISSFRASSHGTERNRASSIELKESGLASRSLLSLLPGEGPFGKPISETAAVSEVHRTGMSQMQSLLHWVRVSRNLNWIGLPLHW